MRSRKQSDSPSDYDREVRPRRILDAFARQERHVREAQDRRWLRRIDACLSTDMRTADDFGEGFCD
jgi:hypothetical protein